MCCRTLHFKGQIRDTVPSALCDNMKKMCCLNVSNVLAGILNGTAATLMLRRHANIEYTIFSALQLNFFFLTKRIL